MAPWILLALWTSANSTTVQPATFNHVRSEESGIRTLIGDGYMRSATFKTLVDTVENLSCVVYVTSAVKLSDGMRGALLHSAAGSRELPVLRVLLKANLAPYEAIAVIGHELQHVIEAVRGSDPSEPLDLAAIFDRLEPRGRSHAGRRYETETAIDLTTRILDELKTRR